MQVKQIFLKTWFSDKIFYSLNTRVLFCKKPSTVIEIFVKPIVLPINLIRNFS